MLAKYVEDAEDSKHVAYNNIHCHTISAVKELDAIVTAQADTIQAQKIKIIHLKTR